MIVVVAEVPLPGAVAEVGWGMGSEDQKAGEPLLFGAAAGGDAMKPA